MDRVQTSLKTIGEDPVLLLSTLVYFIGSLCLTCKIQIKFKL